MSSETLNRILYVEDEPDIQAVAKLALEAVGGFTLEVCSSGQEALDKAEAFAPQLMLLDVMMPEMDGPTTMKKLREFPALANTPVIFMTAKVQPQEVKEYKDLGAVDVIAKPFDPMTLASNIKDIWQGV
ncbi:response regulator [Sulfuriflexus mobilis]|uniref:response regulator n=1 Tax=Sulfuriflexus mobilis TaxID=1811807 RepID=UPI000F816C8E|nr:response regulator [Sulfuriflexus mobilis]